MFFAVFFLFPSFPSQFLLVDSCFVLYHKATVCRSPNPMTTFNVLSHCPQSTWEERVSFPFTPTTSAGG